MPYTTLDILGLKAVKRHLLDKDIRFLKDYVNGLIAKDICNSGSAEVREEYEEETSHTMPHTLP